MHPVLLQYLGINARLSRTLRDHITSMITAVVPPASLRPANVRPPRWQRAAVRHRPASSVAGRVRALRRAPLANSGLPAVRAVGVASSSASTEATAQQIQPATPVHRAFHELQPGHLPFRLPL